MLEDGTEAFYVGVALKVQVAGLGFNVDDVACWGVSELEHDERSGHAGMAADVVRDDLQGDVRLVRGFGQVFKLCSHDRGTADWPVERGFINDGPEPKRWFPGEYGLPTHAGFDESRDVLVRGARHAALESSPGIV